MVLHYSYPEDTMRAGLRNFSTLLAAIAVGTAAACSDGPTAPTPTPEPYHPSVTLGRLYGGTSAEEHAFPYAVGIGPTSVSYVVSDTIRFSRPSGQRMQAGAFARSTVYRDSGSFGDITRSVTRLGEYEFNSSTGAVLFMFDAEGRTFSEHGSVNEHDLIRAQADNVTLIWRYRRLESFPD